MQNYGCLKYLLINLDHFCIIEGLRVGKLNTHAHQVRNLSSIVNCFMIYYYGQFSNIFGKE